jgi:hypothetical protein
MKKVLIKLLFVLAVLGVASSARALTIVPIWDNTIVTNAQAAAITNGIMSAIQTLESSLNDNLTVRILFMDTNVDLGENDTWYTDIPYSQYLSALQASATSVNDSNALSKLPNSSADPVAGNSNINLQLPLLRLLGFYSGYGPDGNDSTIYLNIPLMNLTRPPTNPNKYDLISVVTHEMDEALGFVSCLAIDYPGGPIGPMDLFRYATNTTGLTRTWTPSGDNAYFSIDGTNLWARFNQEAGGDYHDWWSYTNLWAPPGTTPYPQVQDAYATPDSAPNLGSNELAGLDIIGYTLAAPVPRLSIATSSKNHFTLSWPAASSGYVLEQNSNVLSGTWVESATGSTNPAVIAITNTKEFFRLAGTSSSPAVVVAQAAVSQSSKSLTLQQVRHVYRPKNQ